MASTASYHRNKAFCRSREGYGGCERYCCHPAYQRVVSMSTNEGVVNQLQQRGTVEENMLRAAVLLPLNTQLAALETQRQALLAEITQVEFQLARTLITRYSSSSTKN